MIAFFLSLIVLLSAAASNVFAQTPPQPVFIPPAPQYTTQAPDKDYVTRAELDVVIQRLNDQQAADQSAVLQSAAPPSASWAKGKYTVTPYGFLNLDASYETDKTNPGDYTMWANPGRDKKDPGVNLDPKLSRFGLKIAGPGIPGWNHSKTEGLLEADFHGPYTTRNRGVLRLRKAYVAISDHDTRFLIGQDAEIISPLNPATLDSGAGMCVGNVGYRRGVMRVDQQFTGYHGNSLTFQFGLVDNVYRDASSVSTASARYPMLQGRIAFSFGKHRFHNGKPVIFGVSSHIGEEKFTFAGTGYGNSKYLKTWSLNADLDMPLTEKLTLQMEYFIGENLSTIEGGIAQGVDWYRQDTIRSQGGWLALNYQVNKKAQTSLGFLIDDPFNKDVVSGSPAAPSNGIYQSRTYNHCFFANVKYNWSDALMTGFEVALWKTHWQSWDHAAQTLTALDSGSSVRYQFTTRYTF